MALALFAMGIHGYLFLQAANSVFFLPFAKNPLDQLGEETWNYAIFCALLWPLSLWPLHQGFYKILPNQSSKKRWFWVFLSSFIIIILLSAMFLLMSR